MSNWKKKIKNLLPDRIVYLYSILQIYPQYMEAMKINKNSKFPWINFYSNNETVDLIVNAGMSLSRYGDGEFMWMAGMQHMSYQDYSSQFARDLKAAFQNQNSKLLIGIPYGIFDSSKCNLYARMHWEIIKSSFLTRLIQLVDDKKRYCDASITRPYIDYSDREYSKEVFTALKRIWDKRDVVIVEGEKTKLGMGNNLLSNARSIKRIICPAENAYDKIEQIRESIYKYVPKEVLLLGALGPTASILAAQLCDDGYQFVDIGHIDIEYMWFLKYAVLRDTIEGKYVNESGVKDCSDIYDNNEEYKRSILDKIL